MVCNFTTLERSTSIPIKIYLKHTPLTSLTPTSWANIISGATLVFDGNNTSITADTWNEFNLISTFEYNGTDNLLVLVEANFGNEGTGTYSGVGVRYKYSSNTHQYWESNISPPTDDGYLNNYRPNIQITLLAASMVYTSSITQQASTNIVKLGAINQQIIRLKVVTFGASNPFAITSITFTTNGTTNNNDITTAKVFYTTSTDFSTNNQFGPTINNPTNSFSVTGSQTLSAGDNYFWLVYDISNTATVNNFVDATCESFVTNESGNPSRSPSVTDPAGSRKIKGPLSGTIQVGSGHEYTSLTSSGGLFEAINLLGLNGNLTSEVLLMEFTQEVLF